MVVVFTGECRGGGDGDDDKVMVKSKEFPICDDILIFNGSERSSAFFIINISEVDVGTVAIKLLCPIYGN